MPYGGIAYVRALHKSALDIERDRGWQVEVGQGKVALCYLLRGADKGFGTSLDRFIASYATCPPGIDHRLYVILKGFSSTADLNQARNALSGIDHSEIFVDDAGFDLTAYSAAADQVSESSVCFLNTNSQPLCKNWLAKLTIAFHLPGVELAGATGSFESLRSDDPKSTSFPTFPNVHLRSNALIIRRELFQAITEGLAIKDKTDAHLFESGPRSMTRQILQRGSRVLVVGRNGRGYAPNWWPFSDTFRLGQQSNLLVADNQTRAFDAMPWSERRYVAQQTWGPYLLEKRRAVTI